MLHIFIYNSLYPIYAKMNDGRRMINIFWTGGLDSTFRVVELSRCYCTIQPYYIVIGKKKSLSREMKAIKKISKILRKDRRTKATLLDPIVVNEQDIPRDSITFDSWYRLMRGMSWQYYILAKFVNQRRLEMEMGLQFSPNGSVAKCIDESLLVPHPNPNYDVLILDKTRAEQDAINVYGSFCFPKSLYHKTKKEEIDILRKDGYGKVVNHVWFCFKPILGFPCGHCAPCVSSEIEGIKIPRIGKMLYSFMNNFTPKKEKNVLKLNYDYTIQQVSDVYLAKAKDPQTGEVKKLFRLNETGVIILEAMQDGIGIEEIAKRLTDGFDVDFETAKSQVSAFVANLK